MLRIARVAAVHPEDHSADIIMVDDGSRHSGVQVMSWSTSTNTGTHDLPTPSTPASGDKWSLAESTDRDMIAIVGMIGRNPLVLGFLSPQISQMLFKDPNRRVMRHASDVYSTIDGKGNSEWRHPSGLYIRIATDPAHEDLTGKDVDGKWKLEKNVDQAAHFHIELPGKWSLDIEPAAGNVVVNTQGTVNLTAVGAVTVDAPSVTLDTPQTTMTGHCTIQGGLAVSGGEGATVTGNFAATAGSFTHNGTNVGSTHAHGGVAPGASNTSSPN